MPPSAALTARDQRILAGHRSGASLLDLALAEEADPEVVRRALRRAGLDAGPIRPPAPACLADPTCSSAEGRIAP